jgi:threonine synthase
LHPLSDDVTHLECSATGERYAPVGVRTVSAHGKPLLVRYALDAIGARVAPADLAARPRTMWRWRELLPLAPALEPVSLAEDWTPLVALPRTAAALGVATLDAKDEGRLPTASFKARGLALAVTMAKHLGVRTLALPTNGNAGAALAAYCARAGLEAHCVAPSDTPRANLDEIRLFGAALTLVDGQIDDCGRLVREWERERGWFNAATLREPYRLEGKKTMGLELAEQCGWTLPDAIFYPTGGGTGLIGLWKAFAELGALGWIGPARPRLFAVQAAGCAPIVRAFEAGATHAERVDDARTIAHGIRVPAALGDFLILAALRASGGAALAVDDAAIVDAWRATASRDGFLCSPEGAAALAGVAAARARGLVGARDRIVVFNCASPYKYPLPA